jgi:23S rRNA (cytidine2498-2'-O)-methyltransferase
MQPSIMSTHFPAPIPDRLILTADPDFVDVAVEELQAASPGANVATPLAPGVLLVDLGEAVADLAARWRATPPIFVRHLFPVQWEIQLQASPADLDTLRLLAGEAIAPHLDPAEPFSVQTRILGEFPYKPYDLNTGVSETLAQASGAPLDVRAPVQVLSIVCAREEPEDPQSDAIAFVGLSAAADNLSNWAGGMRRFAREQGQISRSEFKLLEALENFGLDLPPNGVALDLGAAPGGWTRVLRTQQQYVTAVDPGDLDPRLAQDRGVRHKRLTAERYLADDPDTFDLIVNDMRMDARDSARLMVGFAKQLYPHGVALMTLKLPEQHRRTVIDHALAILRQAYEIAGARHLFHNRSEITLYLRPKPAASVYPAPAQTQRPRRGR